MDSLGPEFDAFVRDRSTALLHTAYLLRGSTDDKAAKPPVLG